ncbi:hypothetical protein OC834_000291 [Tilletia horrida]|nr:hypothetical protein OC834_000291 [Tilletia horrida]
MVASPSSAQGDPSSSPSASRANPHPVTPDGHYFLWNGWQLWRCTNPALSEDARASLTRDLMAARRAVGQASKLKSAAAKKEALAQARADVAKAKEGLGERGPVWWDEKEGPVVDRKHVKNTPYREWAEKLGVPTDEKSSKKRKRQRADAVETVAGAEPAQKRVTRSSSKRQDPS